MSKSINIMKMIKKTIKVKKTTTKNIYIYKINTKIRVSISVGISGSIVQYSALQ